MSKHYKEHAEQVAAFIVAELVRVHDAHGRIASVNEICRAATAAGLAVSKPLVANLRGKVIKSIRDGHAAVVGDAMMVRAAIPPTLALAPDPEAQEQERARKAQAQAEREAKWAARRAEREAEWAAQREAEKQAQKPQPEETPMPEAPPTETPEAEVASPPANSPETPVPAPSKPRKRAGRTLSTEAQARRAFAEELLRANPAMASGDLSRRVIEKFGVGVDHNYLYAACREARKWLKAQPTPVREPEPVPTPAPAPAPEPVQVPVLAEELERLAREIRGVMAQHGLATVLLTLTERDADWEYTFIPRPGRGGLKF